MVEQKTQNVVRQIQLYPVGEKEEIDRVYRYIRNGMEIQAIMMNQYMSAMYCAHMMEKSEEEIKELHKAYTRVAGSKKGSPYKYDISKYPTGLGISSSAARFTKKKFYEFCNKGLLYGNISLPTYKKDSPLIIPNAFVNIKGSKKKYPNRPNDNTMIQTGIYYKYENPSDFLDALYKERSPELYIDFANNIKFKLGLGDISQSQEIRKTIERCFNFEYKICDSLLGIKDNKIILYLNLAIPVQQHQLDENTVVGVDLGLAVPAMCALNNNVYTRQEIGNYEEFTHKRTHIQAAKKRLFASLSSTKSGHGRAKKLRKLNTYKKYERNFAQTYNHYVSRSVVDFALKNNAKYINIEDLSGFSKKDKNSSFILRNWSYYELQSMIEYKAKMHGIIVRKIAPAYTSQTCSICGHRGNRETQSRFVCTNENCESHKLYARNGKYEYVNADFNAARNIAQSTNFVKENSNTLSKEEIGTDNLVIFEQSFSTKDNFERNGVVLLKADTTYSHNVVYEKSKTIKVMCEDGYFHEFDILNDLQGFIKDADFTKLKRVLSKSK